MKPTKLERLISKLDHDPYCVVTLYDNDKNQSILRNFSKTKILENHESINAFFNYLHKNGNSNLTVQERKKNGNSFLHIETFKVQLGETNDTMETQKTPKTAVPKQKKKAKKKVDNRGTGLGIAEEIQLRMESHKANDLQKMVDKLENNLELITKERDVLKEEKFEAKYKIDKSDSFNQMIATGLTEVPKIMHGLGFLKSEVLGLGAGVENNYSENQKALLKIIESNNDDMIEVLLVVFRKMRTDAQFATDLQNIMIEHQLIVV